MTLAIKPRLLSLAAHFVPVIVPAANETQSARYRSYHLGLRAGQYVLRGTTQDYHAIKADCQDAIRNGTFSCVDFNHGHYEAFNRNYDFDEQQGDMFEITRGLCDKAFQDARARLDQPEPLLHRAAKSALRLIR